MGRTEEYPVAYTGGALLFTLSAITLAVGGIVLAAGASSDSSSDDILETGAKISAAGGVGVLVSIPLLLVSQPIRQPGATTVFEP
jgi:hypothetical protein